MIKFNLFNHIPGFERLKKRVFRRCHFRAETVNQILPNYKVSPSFAVANMNCGSNLDEDIERENVYFSHYCYPYFGLFMKQDSFVLKQP